MTTHLPVTGSLPTHDVTAREVRDDGSYRLLRAGAIYDLLVTIPFATPFTAAWMLTVLGKAHDALGLGGAPLPAFGASHLMFVSFFGTNKRAHRAWRDRARVVHVLDTCGRAFFSAWMAWALLHGASHTVAVFLVLEVGFFVAQAWALRRDSRS